MAPIRSAQDRSAARDSESVNVSMPSDSSSRSPDRITPTGRYVILAVAFLGWLFGGVQLSITSLAMRSAAIDLLDRVGALDLEQWNALNAADQPLPAADQEQLDAWKAQATRWFAWYQCALMFGAATGGFVFGRLGDRLGRSKAMALSILCYSGFSGAACFVQSPDQLLALRFLACLGVGGMWPNGVALVSEAWSNLTRPMVAGVIGTAANIGIFLMATTATHWEITPETWRWVMVVGACPLILGVFSMFAVPESPLWLASRSTRAEGTGPDRSTSGVFRSPLLRITVLGIALATIPLIGGWGSANWMIPWAGEAGEAANPPDPFLKAHVSQARSFTGMVGSLLGGWIASVVGRRFCYFTVSLVALLIAQYTFWFTVPTDSSFLFWVAGLGFFSGIYFGWLPLFLPELFPTRVRATGAGVSFNFGRILTAVTIFATGMLMGYFEGDYARIGRVTSLIFAVGMVVILFTPDTSKRQLDD